MENRQMPEAGIIICEKYNGKRGKEVKEQLAINWLNKGRYRKNIMG